MNEQPPQLYFEDFAEGQRFAGATRTISQEDVLAFSALTGDKHPIHYDADYARATRFGRPIVHGLHLMSLTAVGATPLSGQLKDSMIAFVQQGAQFLKPVFLEDTVTSAFTVTTLDVAPGKGWGKLTLEATLTNQDGDTVLKAFHVYRIGCRPAAEGGT